MLFWVNLILKYEKNKILKYFLRDPIIGIGKSTKLKVEPKVSSLVWRPRKEVTGTVSVYSIEQYHDLTSDDIFT